MTSKPEAVLAQMPSHLRLLMVRVLRKRDPFLLDLLERAVPLTPAQVSMLHDVLGDAMVAAHDSDWEPLPELVELEELSRSVRAVLPNPYPPMTPREWEQLGLPEPFDRYEEYGEERPLAHPPRPLAPQPVPGGTEPLPRPPRKVTGYAPAALARMAELGITPEEIERLVENSTPRTRASNESDDSAGGSEREKD